MENPFHLQESLFEWKNHMKHLRLKFNEGILMENENTVGGQNYTKSKK